MEVFFLRALLWKRHECIRKSQLAFEHKLTRTGFRGKFDCSRRLGRTMLSLNKKYTKYKNKK